MINLSTLQQETERCQHVGFALYMLAFVLALGSNLCLLIMESKVCLHRRSINQPKLLIIMLAVIDLISTAFGLFPRLLVSGITPCESLNFITLYIVTQFSLEFGILMSKLTIVLMGIERFLSFRMPFYYVNRCTVKTLCVTWTSLLLYSASTCTISVFLYFKLWQENSDYLPSENFRNFSCQKLFIAFDYDMRSSTYDMAWSYDELFVAYRYFDIVQDSVLILTLLVCNYFVLQALKGMEKQILQSYIRCLERSANDWTLLSGKEFTRVMIAVNVLAVLLMMPHMMRTLFNHVGICESLVTDFICDYLLLFNIVVNPFLYGLMRRKLRRRIRIYVSGFCSMCRPTNVSPIEVAHVRRDT